MFFPWYDGSNATHVVVTGAVGSLLASLIGGVALWLIARTWGYARHVAVDEKRRTHRYLRSLERRARTSQYWQSATTANRIHFVLIRVVPILAFAFTIALCEISYGMGAVMNASQDSLPKNVMALYNAAKHTTEGEQLAFLQQQSIMPLVWLLWVIAASAFLVVVSSTVYVTKTARLAELDDPTSLLKAINAIRAALSMPALSADDPKLRAKASLLYPD